MPLYYFHVHEGDTIDEGEAFELPDVDAARKAAIRFASELLAEIDDAVFEKDWAVRVTNAAGLSLYEILILASTAPAARRPR